jgi:hypothetical protein
VINKRKVEIAIRSEILESIRKDIGSNIQVVLNDINKKTNKFIFNIEVQVNGNFTKLFKESDPSIIKSELNINTIVEIINKKSEN